MSEREDTWQPMMAMDVGADFARIVNPNEIAVLSADGYEERAVALFNRGYADLALVPAVLSLAARLADIASGDSANPEVPGV